MLNWFLYWSSRIENMLLIPIVIILVGIISYNEVYIKLKEMEVRK
jgi:hypothetical protein